MNKMNKMDKVERYNWAKPGDRGRFCRLPIDSLKFDYSYQRHEVGDSNTVSLAREFSWEAFGVVVVMERSNGQMYVVDGGQRVAAARRRGDIRDVPCVVFASDGRDHEARAFLALNLRRVKVRAAVKFHASARAGIEPEKAITSWLASIGMAVTVNGTDPNGICFPAHLVRTWGWNPEATKQAVLLQREINVADPLHSAVHNALWFLVANGVDVSPHCDTLKSLGGRAAMLQAIKSLEIETNQKASTRLGGIAVLRLINRRRRGKKICLPKEGA